MLSDKYVHKRAAYGEVVGGGFFVFRRGKHTNRIGVKAYSIPFEHSSLEAAQKEVDRLLSIFPDEKFKIFRQVD